MLQGEGRSTWTEGALTTMQRRADVRMRIDRSPLSWSSIDSEGCTAATAKLQPPDLSLTELFASLRQDACTSDPLNLEMSRNIRRQLLRV